MFQYCAMCGAKLKDHEHNWCEACETEKGMGHYPTLGELKGVLP